MADADFTPSITSRSEAKSLGLKLYFTGKPCKQGHVTQRITINGYCQECSRASASRYRENNPERFHESSLLSRRRNRDKYVESRRTRRREQDAGLSVRQAERAHDRISRASAMERGAECYESMRQCKHSHVGLRFTKDYGCVECWKSSLRPDRPEVVAARKARRAKAEAGRKRREYSENNRKSALDAGETRYVGAPCRHGHDGIRWVTSYACVECGRLADAKSKKRSYDREYRASRPDECLARARTWVKSNPGKRKAIMKSYSARRRQNEAGGDSTASIHAWEAIAKKVCYWCGCKCAKNYHVDHYQPLSKGGRHEVLNLVIACPKCNLRKNAKDPYQFAASLGRLF